MTDSDRSIHKPQGVRGVRVRREDSLAPSTRKLLTHLRKELGPHGWSIYVERRSKQLSFEFRNPLSPVASGWGFDPDRPTPELRAELAEFLKGESEFARTKMASPPRRRRQLVGGIRWASTSFGWSDQVFYELIDTLRHFRVLAGDEWEWLNTVGPQVLAPDLERKWQAQMREQGGPRRDQRLR